MWVFVEDDTWVHDVLWVKESLHFAHQLVGVVAPLASHEWCHVATCTVFGFQTAVVLIHYQIHYSAHHAVVLFNGSWSIEMLIKDKMVVAFKGMTVDDCFGIVMFAEELLQVECSLRQMFDGESDVFDEAGGAYFACAAYGREDTATHCPVLARQRRVGCELCRLAEGVTIEYCL